jgi:hypothetical protein
MTNRQIYTNNATSSLTATITAAATSIAITAGTGALFPNPSGGDWFLFTLYDGTNIEICKCTARTGDTFTTVVRGQEGTTPFAFTAGSSVLENVTAGTLAQFAYSGANTDITSLASATTVTTQSANDNSTKIASTAYADRAATSKIQPITASVAASALTLTLNPTMLDFRSATIGSGTVNTRTVAASISVVVSSGSTLGTISAAPNRLAVIAIDNAGTVELAVINTVGSGNLDETTLITTVAEGGAGAADSASVFYSTTARTSVPFRVVGYIESTQATAGTWATAPSQIQGEGGEARAMRSSIVLGTSVASTSGTSIDFTGIPIWVRRVTVNFKGVSTNGTSNPLVQLGDAGGIETSGYLGASSSSSGAGTSSTNYTTGFGFSSGSAANVIHGTIIIMLQDIDNTWVASGMFGVSSSAATIYSAGSKTLSPGPLDRIRITTVAGADTFDAGTININWE